MEDSSVNVGHWACNLLIPLPDFMTRSRLETLKKGNVSCVKWPETVKLCIKPPLPWLACTQVAV